MRIIWLMLVISLLSLPVVAEEQIRVEGLRRLTADTVYSYLPVGTDHNISPGEYPAIIRALYKTGFFTHVALYKDGNVLVIRVKERPAIADIRLNGNDAVPTEALEEVMEDNNFARGRVFNPSVLETFEQELIKQYHSQGKYAATVTSEVKPLKRNRVEVVINIKEGPTATIEDIKFVGNKAFSDKTLLKQFQLQPEHWYSFFTQDDQYSKQRLAGDLEGLTRYYQNRGYLRFEITSTQVSITPNKESIYITIGIDEGQKYRLRTIELVGRTIVSNQKLRDQLTIKSGDVFSRKQITASEQGIRDELSDYGYSLANINPVPEFVGDQPLVDLLFVIDQGKRVYVRRIDIQGNDKTHDEVLRRELRQMEGAWYGQQEIDRSKVRLQRLPYIENVDIESTPVPGSDDLVDLTVKVTERPSGSFTIGAGYGQSQGFLINGSLSQDNFLGTGNRLSLTASTSKAISNYRFSYLNPYYTLDGISRGFSVYYSDIDANELNIADYTLDGLGGDINFGFPLNESDRFSLSLGYEYTRLKVSDPPEKEVVVNGPVTTTTYPEDPLPIEIRQFIEDNGSKYHNYQLSASLSRDTRNRSLFPDDGSLNRLSGTVTLPGSDLQYYKINFDHDSYWHAFGETHFIYHLDVGYGGGYGKTDGLPFFKNYFAGGINSVRGYRANTLGPRFDDGENSGGGFLTTSSLEYQFPVPFLEVSGFRMALFADAGNVFGKVEDFRAKDLRLSAGVILRWLSPLGPLALSYGYPINPGEDDEKQPLQFNLGVPF